MRYIAAALFVFAVAILATSEGIDAAGIVRDGWAVFRDTSIAILGLIDKFAN